MGTPKTALEIGGVTYLEIAVRVLRDFGCEDVSVVGGKAPAGFASIPDAVLDPPVSGPITGLFTALTAADTQWIAVLAVDLPLLSEAFLRRLWGMRDTDCDAIIPIQPDGRLQPLCGFYRVKPTVAAVRVSLSGGQRSIHAVLDRLVVKLLNFPDYGDLSNAENLLLNVNTPADHARILEIVSSPT